MASKTTSRFSPEAHARAVRLVFEHTALAPSEEAAKSAFLSGDQSAYFAGIVAIVLGAALVFFLFPGKDEEERLLAQYHSADISRANKTTLS